MKISISIVVYNGKKHLQQLNSFFIQTALPDEFIAIDDGSDDETLSILNIFVQNAPFEVIVHQNEVNLGYSSNFNTVLSLTSGDLIFLSDQDDYWLSTKIAKIISVFDKEPDNTWLSMILSIVIICSSQLTMIGRFKKIGAVDRSFVTGMTTAVRKEFLDICLPKTFCYSLYARSFWRMFIKYLVLTFPLKTSQLTTHSK